MFTALLPIGVWAELEELLNDMQYMEGLRDGDETWSPRQKGAVDHTFSSWRGFRDTVAATVTGRL